MERLRRFFVGSDRKLRFIWRAVIYWAIAAYVLPPLFTPLIFRTAALLNLRDVLSASSLALSEFAIFLIALITTALLARYERRRVDSYGLPVRQAFGANTAEGALMGLAMTGVVAAGMYLLGGMQVHGIALDGQTLIASALGWFGANIIVGVAEESMYRGYFLQTLWRSIGFWPASIVIALLHRRSLLLQAWREHLGCNFLDVLEPLHLLLRASHRDSVVCCRISRGLRLHAVFYHRDAQWGASPRRAAAGCHIPRARLANGWRAGHRGKLADVSSNCARLALRLVAFPRPSRGARGRRLS